MRSEEVRRLQQVLNTHGVGLARGTELDPPALPAMRPACSAS